MIQPEHTPPVSVEEVRQHLINFIERTWLFDTQADDFIWIDIDRRSAIAERMHVVQESRQLINETILAIGGLTCSTVTAMGGARQPLNLSSWDGRSEQGKMLWSADNRRHELEGKTLISDLRAFHA